MSKGKLRRMVRVAVFAAVLCLLGPIAIPVGVSPVPLTLISFVLCLFACLLPAEESILGTVIYLFLGLAGLPVFSFASAGIAVLLGPTGGYLPGYLILVGCIGLSAQTGKRLTALWGMILGHFLLYLFGTFWYCLVCDAAAAVGIAACVLPYLPGDILKMGLAAALAPGIKAALQKAGVLKI